MADSGARHQAARAMVTPTDTSDSDVSGARLAATQSEGQPPSAAHPVEADWSRLATAPTLLLTPTDRALGDEAASTSRIATPPAMAAPEEQPWFRTGTTVAPPSMGSAGESLAPPPVRKPPNPRVLKIVSGVIAACLLIVALAGLKLVYKRLRAPAPTISPVEESSLRAPAVTAVVAPTSSPPTEAPAPVASPGPAAQGATPAAAMPSARTAPVRATAPRTPAKTTTHRAPAPKKATRGSR